MIRVNLLPAGTQHAAKPAASLVPSPRQMAIGAGTLLVVTALGLGAWFWNLHRQSVAVERDIVRAEAMVRDLQSVLVKVQAFEARKARLNQRVLLIEQLRTGQSAPARVLDQVSRSVPDGLWLADMSQAGADYTLAGFASSMTALSDFVAGLESTGWFRRPVEIIDSEVMTDERTGDLVRFVVKASYADPNAPAAAPVAAKPGN